MNKNNGFPELLKISVTWALIGVVLTALLTLVAAFVALKTSNPHSAAPIAAAVCVAVGAAVACGGACAGAGSALAGVICWVLFTAAFVLLSLCTASNGASLWQYAACTIGAAVGVAAMHRHKPNAAKRVKKLMKR